MECQKHKFSLDRDIHYLNCAYKSPLLKSAELSCTKALIRGRNPYKIAKEDYFTTSEAIRQEFGKLVNTKAENIAITPSASYGFSSVMNNIPIKTDGQAIISTEEFPSAFYALKEWSVRHDQSLHSAGTNEKILSLISRHTSVVIVSSVHWMTGYVYDLEVIGQKCHEVNAVFIVDGTQSVGAQPIDVNKCKIHALVCASYKWLFGPYSMGLLYAHDMFHRGRPIEESWMNRKNYKSFHRLADYEATYRPGAARYNVGQTSNFLLSPILLEGLKQINDWGVDNISAYCSNLKNELCDLLRKEGFKDVVSDSSNHLLALKFEENHQLEKLRDALYQRKIFTSLRGDSIRVSVNVYNDQNDIEQLVQALII